MATGLLRYCVMSHIHIIGERKSSTDGKILKKLGFEVIKKFSCSAEH